MISNDELAGAEIYSIVDDIWGIKSYQQKMRQT